MNPKVGIFFYVDGEIIIDAVPFESGEPYGEAVQHGGHYDYWDALIPKTLVERKFKARAYDAYPRGRVVYYPKRKIFRLYSDRCLKADDLNAVKEKFGLETVKVEFETDEHYQCAKCNPNFLDPLAL